MKNEIILFTDGDINIEVQINPEQETVWLTQKQMEELFDVKHVKELSAMVQQVNETEVSTEDCLSDHVQHYDSKEEYS